MWKTIYLNYGERYENTIDRRSYTQFQQLWNESLKKKLVEHCSGVAEFHLLQLVVDRTSGYCVHISSFLQVIAKYTDELSKNPDQLRNLF